MSTPVDAISAFMKTSERAAKELWEIAYNQGIDDTHEALREALNKVGIHIDAWIDASNNTAPHVDKPLLDEQWVDVLELSERPRNVLNRVHPGLTIRQLLENDPEDLKGITNFGQLSLEEVATKIHDLGVQLPRLWQKVHDKRNDRFR